MDSHASATWAGDLLGGEGSATLHSGVAGPLPVSWPSRTDAPDGRTSPEELIAAAHAACFNMALSAGLSGGGHPPTRLDTDATATFEEVEAGWRLTRMALSVRGEVPGIDADAFQAAAQGAKEGCPVSNALAGNVDISVEATLA